MRRLVVSFLAIPLLALVPAGAAQAVGTCQGLPATIESPGGGTVTGTDGADVILVTAPADVVALGGDDTICVAGGSLDAGSGNDDVSVSGTGGERADLGPGDDTYVSVGQTDQVDLSAFDSLGVDHIDTGLGRNDEVATGARGESNHDVITSTESGLVHLRAGAGSDVRLVGGPEIAFEATDRASYVFDGRLGTVTRNGKRVATYDAGLTVAYEVSGERAGVTVKGSDRADFVTVGRVQAFRAELRAGTDSLRLRQDGPRSGRVEGGKGRNTLTVIAATRITADLALRRLTQVSGSHESRWAVIGFGSLNLSARTIDVSGSPGRDFVVGYGCTVTADGRGGSDVLAVGTVLRGLPTPKCRHRGVFDGGAGADQLIGANGPDVLIGGPGNDEAGGGAGVDRCVAERELGCER